jgi:Protein of unknown function (DUF2934)
VSAAAAVRRPRRTGATHSSKPSAAVASSPNPESIDREAVAMLAYSYWEARGYEAGSPEEDWLRAEQELASRL